MINLNDPQGITDPNGEPTAPENEPQMNRDIQAPAQASPQPLPAMPEPQQKARSKMPQFGSRGAVGEVSYTQCFNGVTKGTKSDLTVKPEPSDVPQLNQNVRENENFRLVPVPIVPQLNHDINMKAWHPTSVGTTNKFQQSNVPKFGAWEGGENYTVFFDNARKKKNNGQIINRNDPQDNPDMFPQNGGPAPAPRAEPKGQQSKASEFGAWENGENVAYKRKAKNGEPTASVHEPQMNRAMHPRKDPAAQARLAPSKSEPRAKVPPFGSWEGGSEAFYTQSFQNVRKNNRNGDPTASATQDGSFVNWGRSPLLDEDSIAERGRFQGRADNDDGYGGGKRFQVELMDSNQDVGQFGNASSRSKSIPASTIGLETPFCEPPAKKGRSKVPQFGDWNEGENGAYTAYFENARKSKTAGPVPDPIEPQLNRDVNSRARPSAAAGTKIKAGDHQLGSSSGRSKFSMATSETPQRIGKQNPGGHSPIHQKRGRLQQRPTAGRGNETKGFFVTWGRSPLLDEDSIAERGRTLGRADNDDVYGGGKRFKVKSIASATQNESFINWGRSPLLDEDSIAERGRTLFRSDNDDVYGGGNIFKVKPMDSNHQDVGQFKNASKSVPASTVGSETPFREKTKLIQLWHRFHRKCTTFYKKAASRVR